MIARTSWPVTIADLRAGLVAAGVEPGDTVIVHSSLSRLGWVIGGAQAVVEALLAAVGDEGTIVMPAHTGIGDPSYWEHPPVPASWWPAIREHWPAFDPVLTPLRGMGAVVECFRRLPGVMHSGHPRCGFVARGPRAAEITAGHPLDDAFGESSPLGRLDSADARIVLIGVGHANNTSLHLAEHRADWPGKSTVTQGAPLLVDGTRQWVTFTDLDHDASDFEALGAAFVAGGGAERRVTVGRGEVVTCRLRDIVDFGTAWLTEHRSNPSHS